MFTTKRNESGCFVRPALHTPNNLSSFGFQIFSSVYVFFGFYVGQAKLDCSATYPSVMVILSIIISGSIGL